LHSSKLWHLHYAVSFGGSNLAMQFARSAQRHEASASMPQYRFNVRRDERLFLDPESQELPGIEEAEAEALHALAEMAKDAIPDTMNRELAVEVADETGKPLLIAKLILRITRDG
jgi:hypothetical protein